MKTTYSILVLIAAAAVFAVPAALVSAQVVTLEKPKTSFAVEITEIRKDAVLGGTLISFRPANMVHAEKISYWKIRAYCSDDMTLGINATTTDHCGTAINIPYVSGQNEFSVLFKNEGQDLKKFSFALKAYDKERNWLHTQERNFTWK